MEKKIGRPTGAGTFTAKNSLDNYINREVGKRMVANGGIRVNKKHIIEEVANYCGIGWETANRVKRNLATPSLPVALKMAEYFGVKVEDIFEIDE